MRSKINMANQKIEELEYQIINIRNELKNENLNYQKAEIMIIQLTLQLEEFKKIKPILDEFLKAYPSERPEKIIEDVKEKKEASYNLLEQMNDLHAKLFTFQTERQNENRQSQRQIEEYANRISEQELNNK